MSLVEGNDHVNESDCFSVLIRPHYMSCFCCLLVSKINPMQNNFFLSTGTGLKIPPAAQQALQMTGSIPFGGIGAPAGEPR